MLVRFWSRIANSVKTETDAVVSCNNVPFSRACAVQRTFFNDLLDVLRGLDQGVAREGGGTRSGEPSSHRCQSVRHRSSLRLERWTQSGRRPREYEGRRSDPLS